MVVANNTLSVPGYRGQPLQAGTTRAHVAFGGVSDGKYGLLRVLNNPQMDTIQAAQAKAALAIQQQQKDELSGLRRHIMDAWNRNKQLREQSGVDQQMIDALRQRDNEYTPEKLSAIESQGGTKVFMGATSMKCRAAEAWMHDILSNVHDRSWGLDHTPVPDLPQEVSGAIVEETMMQLQQHIQGGGGPVELSQIADLASQMREDMEEKINEEAETRAGRMEKKIQDQQIEGNWDEAFANFITNMVTLKAGFIKGPIIRRKKQLVHRFINGKTKAVAEDVLIQEFTAPSPFDMYPSAGMVKCNDGELLERVKFKRTGLEGMKGLPGWDDAAIDLVLLEYGKGGLRNWTSIDQERSELEDNGSDLLDQRDYMEGLEYWGDVQGLMLMEQGVNNDLDGNDLNATSEYQVNCIMIGSYLVYRGLNPDPLGERPYSKSGWSLIPGSFWYKGVPEMMKDLQAIINATIRALVNNEAVASGPQVVYNDTSRIPIGTDLTQIYPLKIHQFGNPGQSSLKPIDFFQPDANAAELLAVYKAFADMTDEYTGIPSYAHGNDNISGAGRALADYENLLTPYGPVEMGEIEVGDKVLNSYGSDSNVMAVYPQGEREIYRMRFNDGEHVDCDLEHRWSVSTHPERGNWSVFTTGELIEKGLYRQTKIDERNPKGFRPKWALPPVECVRFARRDVTIDPYTMGVLLGDGDARCRLTSMDDEIYERIPYELGTIDNKSDGNRSISRTIKGIRRRYRAYGMNCKSPAKFIPEDYLYNTKEIRLELLRGLMDIDGCASTDGEKIFLSTASPRLRDDFKSLVASLGATNISVTTQPEQDNIIQGCWVHSGEAFRINFNLPNERIFWLSRKADLVRPRKQHNRYIVGIEPIGTHSATCITVDAKDSLFICANYVPTHNTMGGLSMLMSSAARGIKMVIGRIDREVITTVVRRQYNWNMAYDEDEGIKGDVNVNPRGALAHIIKEAVSGRRMEYLNATNNDLDNELQGLEFRQEVLRETAKSLDVAINKFRTGEEWKEQQALIQARQQAEAEAQQVPQQQAA